MLSVGVCQSEQQAGLSARIKILETRLEEQATELQRVNSLMLSL